MMFACKISYFCIKDFFFSTNACNAFVLLILIFCFALFALSALSRTKSAESAESAIPFFYTIGLFSNALFENSALVVLNDS